MKTSCRRLLCLVLALLITATLLPPTQAAEYEADSEEVQEEVPQLPVEKDAPAELAAEGEWLTVPGIEGGQIQFDSSTGTITDCEETVTVANIPTEINGVAVTGIGYGAFSYCTDLTEITLPSCLISIEHAFTYCDSLTEITIPGSVTNIGAIPFSNCGGLTGITVEEDNLNYCSQDGVLFNKDKTMLIQYPGGKMGAYAIPAGITNIASGAFIYCDNLTEITLPGSLVSVGNSAFAGCSGLTEITIPGSVTNIGICPFSDCGRLTGIAVEEDNLNYCSQDGVLFNKDKTMLIQYPGGKMGAYAIPAGITDIADRAFSYCGGLTEIAIPNGITRIGFDTFFDCTGLTGVTIPNSVTSIGHQAFWGCTSLTGITIPDSVTSIGGNVFYGCASLADVYYGGSQSQWAEIVIGEYNDPLQSATFHYYVNCPCEILSVEAEEAALTADVIGEADATAYCAFYDANGRMLQVTSEALAEELTELTFPVPGGAARGKVMLLSPEKLPLCLSKEILIP